MTAEWIEIKRKLDEEIEKGSRAEEDQKGQSDPFEN